MFVEFHFRGNVVEERAIDELLAQSAGRVNAVTGNLSRLQTLDPKARLVETVDLARFSE